jgi:dTDP-4-amino-4,6-dideoxygalactose transaminase
MYLFVNKAWGYGDVHPDHYFLALNYRMSELQGAVAVAQLEKLEGVVQSRIDRADELTDALGGLPGVEAPFVSSDNVHAYWKYCLRVRAEQVPGGAVALGRSLKEKGISCAPRYIQKPAFMCEVFQKQRTFGSSRYPFTLARPEVVRYDAALYPLTIQALDEVVVLPWNENYTREHVCEIAGAVNQSLEALTRS